jgi:hypothetical protein
VALRQPLRARVLDENRAAAHELPVKRAVTKRMASKI